MSAHHFADATAVVPRGDGTYGATVHPGWDIMGNANGGYLIAIAARAMLDASGREDPVTLTAHYLRPGRPGPVVVTTEVIKSGRMFGVVRAVLHADDGTGAPGPELLALLGTFGSLASTAGPTSAPAGGAASASGGADLAPSPELVVGTMPDLPPLEDCVPLYATDTFPPPFMGPVELRLHPDDAGFATGAKSGSARIRGWFRLRDGEPIDTIGALQAADAFPPTIFNADLPVAWTPTVELTVQVRARPSAGGWLACAFRTQYVTGGFLEADGELWEPGVDGAPARLVAHSRQLALVPRPD